MTLSAKPLIKAEKKIRASRKVPEVIPEVIPEVVPEVIPEVIPEVVPEEIPEPLAEFFAEMGITNKDETLANARLFIDTHGIDVAEKLVNLMDELSSTGDSDDPISPASSPKKIRLKKPSQPKPLVNEKGEYLNPRTNRYVKEGTTLYKQLVKDGIIKIEE